MKIRGKVENADRPGELIEVEFEIPDDSPEAKVLRESALGSWSIAPVEPPEQPRTYSPDDWVWGRPAGGTPGATQWNG